MNPTAVKEIEARVEQLVLAMRQFNTACSLSMPSSQKDLLFVLSKFAVLDYTVEQLSLVIKRMAEIKI